VSIILERRDGDFMLMVRDDGVGMDPTAPPRGSGLGQPMVHMLAAQIGGTFQAGRGANGGTKCTVRWRSPLASSGRARSRGDLGFLASQERPAGVVLEQFGAADVAAG
jgi:signal transduction histidine kinase